MGKKSLLQEFKSFAMKGHVIDMAIGVIIGGAFGKIVSSLVADVIMPFISILLGGVNLVNMKWVLKAATVMSDGKEVAAITLNYGRFLQSAFDFLIIALSIFFFIKLMNNFVRKTKETPAPAPSPTKEEVLLTEIRDLLKEK
ncbi:large-conductance mechanosensitive channel protein MscL [uncultured Bacteroides sp.]|uniref:large-conductance mechanosensitive channel protein MscL n=1 Tax=uncultured Bacteroides sp. TaxID=162156 RepID=UPI002AABC416|nr:large-conductance mechanosensitive channel protein MscL [uncultured Bacteroides sp.]